MRFESVDDDVLRSIKSLLDELPIAPADQVKGSFRLVGRVTGFAAAQLTGDATSILQQLEKNLGRVSKRRGFSYHEAKALGAPFLEDRERSPEDASQFLSISTFVGAPDTYAFPHHIWRTGENTSVLGPDRVQRESWWQFWKP